MGITELWGAVLTLPDLSPLWVSLRVSGVATTLIFVSGTATAYGLHRYRGRGRSLVDGLLLTPLVLPPTVVGFGLLLAIGRNGPVGQLLQYGGLRLVFTWYAAVLAAVVVAFPLFYRAAIGAFEQIDPALLDAARVEGASEWAVFWHIALPLAFPGILAGTLLAFARALGEFGATLMVAGNVPGQTQTIPIAIYFAVEAGALKESWFWTGVIVVISLTGAFVMNQLNRR